MRLINDGTSMLVGHAVAQGASKQYKQRSDSKTACACVNRGVASLKRRAYSDALSRPGRTSGEGGMDTLLLLKK
jgi:hypothetical protein